MTNYQKLRILNSAAIVTPTIFNNLLNLLSINKSNTIGITAKPGGQATATRLYTDMNTVATVGATGDAVKLPDALKGMSLLVKNDAAKILTIFPYETDKINNGSPNSAVTILPGDYYQFDAIDSTGWVSTNLRGSTGPVGVTGPAGTPGATGSTGAALPLTPPSYDLGIALPFALLTGGSLTVSNSQLLITNGNVGETTLVNPSNITLLGDSTIVEPATGPAQFANTKYLELAGLTGGFTFGATNLELVDAGYGVARFVPGIYRGTVSIITAATQTITLVGDGDYVFISDAEITFGADTIFVLKNGARASRIFWVAAGAITTGANNVIKGNFLSQFAINVGSTNDVEGRLLSTLTAAITVDGTATTLTLPTS